MHWYDKLKKEPSTNMTQRLQGEIEKYKVREQHNTTNLLHHFYCFERKACTVVNPSIKMSVFLQQMYDFKTKVFFVSVCLYIVHQL